MAGRGSLRVEVIDGLDLAAFLSAYRADGHGRAAHDPAMMVALLVYAYAIGERSSRRIERRCNEDVAFRVITANQVPAHATVARFRVRHEAALSELFGQVLGLCADAGMVRVGVVAVDGTKVHANASERSTRDCEQIAREILDDAAAVDAVEDDQLVEQRGDELPPALSTRQLEPMIVATDIELATAGVIDTPEVVLADAGYWHTEQIQHLTGRGHTVLVPPDAGKRKGARPGWDGGLYAFMRRALATDRGGGLYAKRNGMIEPVFANTKFNRRIDRFQRRGRAAARSEWRLTLATHNLLKLHTHTLTATGV